MACPKQLSFVVPLYNGEAFIEKCLQGLLAQGLSSTDYEIIVVDNSSTDNGRAVAERFPVQILSEPRRGAGAARNAGLATAQGKHIAFVDADVVLSPNWAQRALEALRSPWVDCVTSRIFPTSELDDFMGRFRQAYIALKTCGQFHYLGHAKAGFPIVNSAAFMLKREALMNGHLRFDPSLPRAEDNDFSFQLFCSGAHLALLRDAHAHVYDGRSWRQYLARSFMSNFYCAKLARSWGKLGALSSIFTTNLDHGPALALSIVCNELAARAGRLLGGVDPSSGAKSKTYYRQQLKNYFLGRVHRGESLSLGVWVRIVDLGEELILVDLQSERRSVLSGKTLAEFRGWLTGQTEAEGVVEDLLAWGFLSSTRNIFPTP